MSSKGTVVITGCSLGGIGASLARLFAARNYHVFATVRTPSKAQELDSLPNIDVIQLDVTSKESIAAAVKEIGVKSGHGEELRVDVLVNNAGMGSAGPLMEVDLDEVHKVFNTNVWGMLAVTQAFKEALARAGGKIVNISSVGGLYHTPWIGVYSSSKAAVTLMSETMRLELVPLGISVITAMLGAVESNVHVNDTGSELPEDSDYKSIESFVANARNGEIGPKRQGTDALALNLVNDIENNATGQVWRGSFATVVRYSGYHFPTPVLDMLLLPGSGLNELKKQK